MKIRWCSHKHECSVEFDVNDVDTFREAVTDGLIEFRTKSKRCNGGDDVYPPAVLEVFLPTGKWCSPKLDNRTPWNDLPMAMRAPTRHSCKETDVPSDSDIIEESYNDWWVQLEKIHRSAKWHQEKKGE